MLDFESLVAAAKHPEENWGGAVRPVAGAVCRGHEKLIVDYSRIGGVGQEWFGKVGKDVDARHDWTCGCTKCRPKAAAKRSSTSGPGGVDRG